ncbi:MAG: hypothetical protein IPJ88_02665 [Myxococcales bacterium]|nr:MAG: hypothetical protein IPJ88_02665 [Myxococcales bacterium]
MRLAVEKGISLWLLLVFVPEPVFASPLEFAGIGSVAAAKSSAVIASETGPESSYYNPAALAFSGTLQLQLSYQHLASKLSYGGPYAEQSSEIDLADLGAFAVSAPITPWLSMGLALQSPLKSALSIDAPSIEDPHFPYYENRSQRISLFPALALRPLRWLSLGLALNYFSSLRGSLRTAMGGSRATEASLSAQAESYTSFIAGLRVVPLKHWRFALVYRHAFSVPYEIVTENLVGGTPLDIAMKGYALASPHTLELGVAYQNRFILAEFDLGYQFFSVLHSPFVQVDATVSSIDLGLRIPKKVYNDAIFTRASLSLNHALSQHDLFTQHFGFSLTTSMLNEQTGRSNLLDAPKLGLSTGSSIRFEKLFGHPLILSAHAALSYMRSVRSDKVISSIDQARANPNALADEDETVSGMQLSNPGYPYIVGEAIALSIGLSVAVEFEP